ncbi:MAG: 2-oxoacid:acceptor oxidoreductase subunit alpha [Chloroflexi bacterium]|nr:2-oxoacid:acceptor oxidoreductase subunit alpha [Chloroflexota bacterium]
MAPQDLNWLIGGPQGSGINLSADTFAKALTRAGYRVYTSIEYHSNIMGEQSYVRVRISPEYRASCLDEAHVVVALDDETLLGHHGGHGAWSGAFHGSKGHLSELAPGGVVVYDAALRLDPSTLGRDDVTYVTLPFDELLRVTLREFGKEDQAGRLRVMTNTIAVGASLAAIGLDPEEMANVIREGFKGRRAEMGDMNARAVHIAAEYVRENYGDSFQYRLWPAERPARTPMLIRGMQACAIAKIQAGLTFQSYYPISPATDENVYLEGKQRDYDVLVVQVEDEVSAINMAVGAAHAGARSSTSTSGPGLALMSEGVGLASITEAPGPVVFIWMRGGPSTGLPTRQEQGDLKFALNCGQGEYPTIVVCPGDIQEIAEDSFEVFNWADQYQVPIIVLVDKMQATSYYTIDDIDMSGWTIDRGPMYQPGSKPSYTGNGLLHDASKVTTYLRYAPAPGGVSPRSIPGMEGGIFTTTSDEHDPKGNISEAAVNRIEMMNKRMGKLDYAASRIPADRKCKLYGPAIADFTLVSWGSTKGAILDAMAVINASDGPKINYLHVRLMRPFPVPEVTEILSRAKKTVLVECNYTGQLGLVIREQTGITLDHQVLKIDGRPFSQEELIEGLRDVFENNVARATPTHLSA